jgi:hypothetical protein
MATVEQGPVSSNDLISRVKNILFTPSSEWDRIEAEPATVQGLYLGYACILAAIGPIARLIGGQLFGWGFLFIRVHPSLIGSIVSAIVGYLLSLVGVYVTALIIDALAPSFGGTKNQIQAFKVAVYSSTAAWVAGIFGLFPLVAALGIIGIWSLYLLYLGLPKLMKAPEDKALAYTVVTVIVAVVIWVCIAAVGSAVAGAAMFGAGGLASNVAAPTAGVVSVGGTSVDLGKLQAASKQAEAQAQQIQAAEQGKATIQAVPADTLKGLLPASLPGYTRTDVSADSGQVGGLQGSSAEAVYTKGEARITLKVTDAAAAGAMATLGGALGVNSEHTTATGYEKVHMDGGRMVAEKWDSQSKDGDYSVMIASRFMIDAEGSGADMAELKAAVQSIPADRLASLAPAKG